MEHQYSGFIHIKIELTNLNIKYRDYFGALKEPIIILQHRIHLSVPHTLLVHVF
jgi:hypothetical protein